MKTIIYERPYWEKKIKPQLVERHGKTTMAISWVCRRELGFTVRTHQLYCTSRRKNVDEVHLDFQDEEQYTAYILTHD